MYRSMCQEMFHGNPPSSLNLDSFIFQLRQWALEYQREENFCINLHKPFLVVWSSERAYVLFAW